MQTSSKPQESYFLFWALGTEAIATIKERFSQNIKINCYIMMVKYRFPKPAKPDPSYRSTI